MEYGNTGYVWKDGSDRVIKGSLAVGYPASPPYILEVNRTCGAKGRKQDDEESFVMHELNAAEGKKKIVLMTFGTIKPRSMWMLSSCCPLWGDHRAHYRYQTESR